MSIMVSCHNVDSGLLLTFINMRADSRFDCKIDANCSFLLRFRNVMSGKSGGHRYSNYSVNPLGMCNVIKVFNIKNFIIFKI